MVLDRTALRFSPLRNGTTTDKVTGEIKVKPDNRIPAAVRLFENVPETPLKVEFYRLAHEHSPDLANALGMRFPSLTLAVDNPDVPFPPEAPSEPLDRSSQAPSREEASREELSGEVPPCSWCGESALVIAGEVQVGPGDLPWCGWCEQSEGVA